MTKLTAIFSNGHRDPYKGTRPVKAGWMITRKEDGKVLASGHSLDRVKAHKTAAGNVSHVVTIPGRYPVTVPRSAAYATPQWAAHTRKTLAALGVEVSKGTHGVVAAAKAHNAELNAEKRNLVDIEVVDLTATP